jgi:hypothetical protein
VVIKRLFFGESVDNKKTTIVSEIRDLFQGSYFKFAAQLESPENINENVDPEELSRCLPQYFFSIILIKALESIGADCNSNNSNMVAGAKAVASQLRENGHYVTTTQIKLLTRSKRAKTNKIKSNDLLVWNIINQISANTDLILQEILRRIELNTLMPETERNLLLAQLSLTRKSNEENYLLVGQLLVLLNSYSDEDLYMTFKGNTKKIKKFNTLLDKLTRPH